MKSITLFSIILIAVIYFSSCEYNPVEPYDPTPKVSIVNPVNNSTVSDSVTVSILVNNINVKRVELFIDHNLVYDGVFENPPYEYFWDCRWYQDGSQHILQAKAYNQSGKVIESDFTIINIYRFMPSGLTANITSDTTIFLHWYDNCKYETGFQVESAIDDSNFIKVADLDSNTTSFTFNGQFVPEKQYLFRVRAVANDQFSGYSDIATAEIKLAEPINLGTSLTSDTSITFFWTDNNSFEQGYVISKEFGSGFFVPIKTLPANSTNTVISDVFLVNQQYRYTIHAVRDYYESLKALFPFVPLQFPTPSELSLESATQSSVKIKWKDNSTFENGFIIMRKDQNGGFVEAGRVSRDITSFIDTDLDTSNTYTYFVQAFSQYNLSQLSNTLKIFFSKTITLNKKIQVPNGISEAAVSSDFSLAAFGGYISNGVCIRVFNLSDGTIIRTFLGDSTDQIFERLAISPDNKFVAGIGNYHTLSVFDITTGLLVKRLELGTTPNYIKYSSDGKFLIMERNKKLRFYNTTNWSAEDRMFYNDDSYCMGVDNNDQFVAVGFFNSNAKIYNYQSGSYVQDIPGSFRTFGLKYNLDNKKLIYSAYGSLKILDFNSNTITNQLDNIGDVRNFDVTNDDGLVIFTGYEGISLWNTQKNKSFRVSFGSDQFGEVAISPDNSTLFAREYNKSYVLCDFIYQWIRDAN